MPSKGHKIASKQSKLNSRRRRAKSQRQSASPNEFSGISQSSINTETLTDSPEPVTTKPILPNEESEIPLILCGDLNISHSEKLQQMLKELQLINGPLLSTLQHSIVGQSKELMDYILIEDNHSKFKSIERRIIDFSTKLKEKTYNLSDHYPIEAVFNW